MDPHKEYFHDFSENDGGTVLMGNDQRCTIRGVGSVRLRLDDGVEKIISYV